MTKNPAVLRAEAWVDKDPENRRLLDGTHGIIVTRDGYIYTTRRGYAKRRKHQVNRNGYLEVDVDYGTRVVHRMVAQTFVKNPDPKLYTHIRHVDGDRTNNHANNLVWCTYSDLMYRNQDRYRPSRRKPIPVEDIHTGITYKSMSEASRQTPYSLFKIWCDVNDEIQDQTLIVFKRIDA